MEVETVQTASSVPPSTRWVAFGEAALAELEAAVARARQGDPLAAVTVLTPSPSVAVTTRRLLGRRARGLAGLHLLDLAALAEQIAAPHIAARGIEVGVDQEVLVAAARVALRRAPGSFRPIAHHRSTWEAVAATVAELGDCPPQDRAAVAAAGGLRADLVRLHDEVSSMVGGVGSARVLRLATEVVDAGEARLDGVGPVVCYLPGLLGPLEVDFLRAVAARVPLHLVLGATGRQADDRELARRLAPLGVSDPGRCPSAPARTEVLSANDIDDEVRAALRRLLAHAEHAPDAPVPLHRMALVHPAGAPYAGVVAEVLRSTGIPASGPNPTTLVQSAPGRVLLGLLDVAGSGFGRQEVVDLWSSGLVFDDAGVLPFARFDELSRRLGVVGGIERWHEAIRTADEHEQQRLDQLSTTADAAALDGIRARRDSLAHLQRSLEVLVELCASLPASWADVAPWASDVIDRLCGPVVRRSWPDHELAADGALRTALGRLAALAEVEDAPTTGLVRDTIRSVLDVPAPRRAGSGVGLLVTTPEQPPLVPLEAVAVVGLAEGQLPRIVRDDVLLGEELRRSLGLAVADDRHRTQRRGFDSALASASGLRLLSHARNDQRTGRSLVPSRWLLEVLAEVTGQRPDAEALMEGRPVPGVEVIPSFAAGLRAVSSGTTAALDAGERTLAALVAAGGVDGHPAAAADLGPGVLLARSRRARAFTRFDGDLAGDGVDVTELGVLSPTSIETYASCPRRWFFSHVLGLGEVDRPEGIDRIQPRDRGTLVHRVLERFFGEAIEADEVPEPGRDWSPRQRARLTEIAHEECELLERRGLTGHPRWWEHDREEIHGVLQTTLVRDTEVRAELGTRPVAVEFTFGRRGRPPLEIDLGGGRVVRLAGQADRVDRAGRSMHVWDYKYSGGRAFEALEKDEDKGGDPLLGGTKIQLVAYGMAAAQQHDVDHVHASYWLLRPDVVGRTVGYEVDAGLRERFRRVLAVVADGIAAGRFPARPGTHEWHLGNFANCTWCEFDSICPGDRDVEWQRVQLHPALRDYVRLTEEGSATVLEDDR